MTDQTPHHDDDLPDPMSALFRALGGDGASVPEELQAMGVPNDPAALQAMLAQVQRMFTSTEKGPVNWSLARDIARGITAEQSDRSIGGGEERLVSEALRTADLWLDRVCDLSSTGRRSHAWSRAEWVENTLPVWQEVIEPIAEHVGEAMSRALAGQLPAEQMPLANSMMPMLRQMGGGLFGAQIGQALGALAGEVVSGGETGLPLVANSDAVLMPASIAAFAKDLSVPLDEVRLYLALREVAYTRLVVGVPWLRAHLLGAVAEYARGITIDTDRIAEMVTSIDPTEPMDIQQQMAQGLFSPEPTPAQQVALDRLETALALVEGWVDTVTHAAATASLPHANALREVIRRRRATSGPAEQTFATLVGLHLRPRRLREAAAVWEAVTTAHGTQAREALWEHPDLVPGPEAFSDPAGYAAGLAAASSHDAEFDSALAALLDEAPQLGNEGPATDEKPEDSE